jgi:hypothetical protein
LDAFANQSISFLNFFRSFDNEILRLRRVTDQFKFLAAISACMWDELMASNQSSSFQGFYRHLHTPAVIIGAVFALVALLISLWLILKHLRSYSNPAVSAACSPHLTIPPVYVGGRNVSSVAKFVVCCYCG